VLDLVGVYVARRLCGKNRSDAPRVLFAAQQMINSIERLVVRFKQELRLAILSY